MSNCPSDTDPSLTPRDPDLEAEQVEHFSIRDASLVTAPDMDRLRAFAERTRDGDGTYILQAVLEQAHIIPTNAPQEEPQRSADLAHIQKSARWYQETLFKDYWTRKRDSTLTQSRKFTTKRPSTKLPRQYWQFLASSPKAFLTSVAVAYTRPIVLLES